MALHHGFLSFSFLSLFLCVLCVLCGEASSQPKSLGTPPLILLHFDDTDGKPADSSGQEHVVANHGATAGVEGKFGKAYEFDGKASYVNAGNNYSISFAFATETIEFWLNPRDTGKKATIMGTQEKPDGGSWRWAIVRGEDGTIQFSSYDNAQTPPTQTMTSKTPAAPGQWTHVAVTIDCGTAQKMRLFINGKEEDSGVLKTCSPYGSLFIGSGREGFFAGRLDEVAVYDNVLSNDLIAQHASGKAPIADGMVQAAGGKGFRLAPIDATANVAIRHSAFPGKSWTYRMPEYAYRDAETNKPVQPSGVVWERLEDGSLKLHWGAPDELKKKQRLDYWGSFKPGEDVIDFELTAKNVGDKPWGEKPWGGALMLFCLQSSGNPDFHDYEAHRTYAHRGGKWVTMNEVVEGKFKEHRMCGITVNPTAKTGADRLAVKVSKDGKWVMGIATDIATSLSYNFQLRASCMHSNPTWPNLKPGEEATAKGKIYLLKGSLDDLWERYKKDFPE